MALKLTKYSPIDMQKYLNHLSYLGFVYYDLNGLSFNSRKMQQEVSTLKQQVTDMIRECSGGVLHNGSKYNVEQLLTRYKGIPESMLLDRKTGKVSLEKNKLTRAYERGFAKEFISLYLYFTSVRAKSGLLASAVSKCDYSDVVSNDGAPLAKVTHNIKESANLRTYYNDFNHQQLSEEALKCMKAPKGYFLVMGDFEQSDLKITYNMTLRDAGNIDIMFRCKDSYEGISRVVEGDEFSQEKFKTERPLYKENTLATVYGAQSASSKEGARVVNNMKNYLSTLPVYNEFKSRIEKRIDTGLPVTVRTYFGNTISINAEKDSKGILDAALNAPSQTGTSEIVIACANAIMDKFTERGITEENGGIYLYLNRHDELIFLIKDEHLAHCDIFQECQDILVDDWMPLRIEFSYSDNYIIPNEYIDRLCKSCYKDLESIDVQSLIDNAKDSEFFIPCEDTLRLCVGVAREEGRSVLSFYNLDSENITYHEVGSSDKNDLVNAVCKIIGSKKTELFKNDVTAVLVYTDLLLHDQSIMSGLPIVFKINYNDAIYRKAQMAAEYKLKELNGDI